MGPKICIPEKFSGDVDDVGLGTILWTPLLRKGELGGWPQRPGRKCLAPEQKQRQMWCRERKYKRYLKLSTDHIRSRDELRLVFFFFF